MKQSEFFKKGLHIHVRNLFPICRSITGDGIRKTLKYFENFHSEYKSKVVLTSGDDPKSICEDLILDEKLKIRKVKSKKIKTKNSHGSGCTFSTALCINLANNKSLYDSVVSAKKFTEKSLVQAPKLGLKYGPVGHQSFFK